MTPLPVLAIDLLTPSLPSVAAAQTQHELPWNIRLISYVSGVGAITAVATLVYGIASNIFGWIAMGAILLATSLSSFYIIHQFAELNSIQEDTVKIRTLNASIALKERQIQELSNQIKEITLKFTAQEKDFIRLVQRDDELDIQLNKHLKQAAETLAKAQADAQIALDKTSRQLTDQILALQQQSQQDQKTIADLNQAVTQASQQVGSLKASLIELKQQIATYKLQNSEYSRLNTQLQLQLKTLTEAARSPDVDVDAINAHAAKLEASIALQKTQADRTAKTTAQISSMLDALTRRFPPKT